MAQPEPNPNAAMSRIQRMQSLTLLSSLSPEEGRRIAVGSFDPEDIANLQRVVECELPAEYTPSTAEGEVLWIVDWFACWYPNVARIGEDPSPGVRVTLWDHKGDRFAFVGSIATRCWEKVILYLGHGPYKPPIPVTVQRFKLPSGRETYGVIPVSDATVRDGYVHPEVLEKAKADVAKEAKVKK